MARLAPLYLALLVLLALAGQVPVQAQHATLSLGATGGVPQSDFGDRLNRVGFGFSGTVLYGVGPVSAGVEAGMMTYERQAAPLAPVVGTRTAILREEATVSGIGHLHAVVRLELPEGPIRPYVDGLVGFQRFTSKTDFDQTVLMVSDGLIVSPAGGSTMYTRRTSSLESDDVALSYGGGAGVLLRLAQGHDEGTPYTAFLDLGARYLVGEEATYRLAGTDPETGEDIFGVARSSTNLLRPQISLVVTFGR
jgi:hypothetical protein